MPKMDLIRKHLMIEGHISKECLVKILQDVSHIYRKFCRIAQSSFSAFKSKSWFHSYSGPFDQNDLTAI